MFYILTGDFRSLFIIIIKIVFLTNFISLFASHPAGGKYICIIIIILFDFVCDRLSSLSDLVKSWGGGGDSRMRSTSAGSGLTGHSIILYVSPVARALLIALWLQVHTKGGKLRYKYSSARPHGHT